MIRVASIKGICSQVSHTRNSLALAEKNLYWKKMKALKSTTLTSTAINKNEGSLPESKKCISDSGEGIKLNFFPGIPGIKESEAEITISTASLAPTK